MNWANRLTIGRLVLTLVFVATLSLEFRYSRTIALILFIIAGISDMVDGMIARRWNLITDFGKLMDPLVDKIMMAAAFILLVPLGAIPAWVVIVIVSREFLVTGLRLLALSNGRVLAAESLGKHKTVWQIITAVYFLLLLALQEWNPAIANGGGWWLWAWNYGGPILYSIATLFTIWSGLGYLWNNRSLIAES